MVMSGMKKYLVCVLCVTLLVSCDFGKTNAKKIESRIEKKILKEIKKKVRESWKDLETGQKQQEQESEVEIIQDTLLFAAKLENRSEQLLTRTGYVTSYNKDYKIPNWVGWILTDDHTSGPYKRNGLQFHEDEDVDYPRATHFDYMQSGYDRGHMCPAGDNKWNRDAIEETFLMTNICPQDGNLNKGDWNELENKCRSWAKKMGKIYIVCGPILYNKEHKRIGKSKVTVPEAFFKIVLCLEGNPKGIGFIYKNQSGNNNMNSYVNSIDQVERITGIDFFSNLDENIQNIAEAQCNLEEWR